MGRGSRLADDWVERVRAASDIVEVIGQTVPLRRAGRNWTGLCPFHKEKTPSFSVNADRQFYHCFGCKAGGDVFRFVQETENVGFLEAVELLSRRAGIPVPERRAGERSVRTPLLEALEQSAASYEQWLADPDRGRAAREMLEARGVSRETARAFRLGLAPEGWDHLATRLAPKLGEDILVQAGLAMRRDTGRGVYDRFRNRLMVPLVAPGGAVVGFGARALGDDPPKYLNSPETPVYHKGSFLFALDLARKPAQDAGEIVVVEGYFDAIALHQAGIAHTVATSGTALTADQARLLKRAVPRVALTYDGDQAGQDAMMRSLAVLLAEELDVVVVDLPRGDDPDTLVRRDGVDGWRRVRAAAYDPVEFVQRHVLRAATAAAGDPRERALQALVGLAVQVRDPIRLRLLIERASQVFALGEGVVARAVALQRSGQSATAPIQAAVREQRRGESELERMLLRALLEAPLAIEDAKARVSVAMFRDAECAALAEWLWSGRADLPDEGIAAVLARELVSDAGPRDDWTAVARGASLKMEMRALDERKKQIRSRLAHSPSEGATELLLENQAIAERIVEITRAIAANTGAQPTHTEEVPWR
ncbi:MAG: DNA primase [Candidatus Eisenbacteria bacterium]|uniref:DNA primase n=1 Tax=Eiseniibacteriota bacterium TaxID=2212470 RepID=A0A9D6L932_UNCEI|nr:DNA primase [Candidatus Eisenbacteria bacterium]MBI3539147.1 DNA primase [Candidatus Eisenbacteria bacterium]